VIEKPLGTDLETAVKLNDTVAQVFDENQVYRIDHYLGKEMVQNLLVFWFANAIFEPVWKRNDIHNVQITVAESIPVLDRGGYDDQSV
jgi:glucose-6-phosphate 1-dehydrogenase